MLIVTINTDNAAFDDGKLHSEVARILRDIAKAFEAGVLNGKARDVNGNSVATFSYTV